MRGLFLLLMLLSSALYQNEPELSFVGSRLIDYGRIKEGEIATVDVKIKNTGDDGLVILSAVTTCNCTSVKYPRQEFKNNEEGVVHILVDTKGKYGKENVVIKLLTNTEEKYAVIRIDLDVY